MKLILLGCPGSGKGTQAQFLLNHYQIPLISTGDMLRAVMDSDHPLAGKIKAIMKTGALVNDDVIIELIKERLQKADCQKGYILDGFPRTLIQAQALQQAKVAIDTVVEIRVADHLILERLTGRMIHPASGRSYHVLYCPPKVAGRDDLTGEILIQREDDRAETVTHRLKVYHEKTEPLVAYYQHLATVHYLSIDGDGGIEQVSKRILDALKSVFG